jgi:hypothetical protein
MAVMMLAISAFISNVILLSIFIGKFIVDNEE